MHCTASHWLPALHVQGFHGWAGSSMLPSCKTTLTRGYARRWKVRFVGEEGGGRDNCKTITCATVLPTGRTSLLWPASGSVAWGHLGGCDQPGHAKKEIQGCHHDRRKTGLMMLLCCTARHLPWFQESRAYNWAARKNETIISRRPRKNAQTHKCSVISHMPIVASPVHAARHATRWQ